MSRSPSISDQAERWINRFINDLQTHDDLNPKTLRDYVGDLRLLAEWVETGWSTHQEDDRDFHIPRTSPRRR